MREGEGGELRGGGASCGGGHEAGGREEARDGEAGSDLQALYTEDKVAQVVVQYKAVCPGRRSKYEADASSIHGVPGAQELRWRLQRVPQLRFTPGG